MDFPLLEPVKEPPEVKHYQQRDIFLGKTSYHYAQAGKGKTLLLIHGWSNNWQGWIPLSEHLKKKYNVVMPDMPGFGDSFSPGLKYTVPMQAYWIRQFINKKKLKPQAIIGLSMGSFVAAYFCQKYPQLAKKCVLIGPVLKSTKNPRLTHTIQKLFDFAQNSETSQSMLRQIAARRLYAYFISKYINMYKFNRFLVDSYGLIGKQKMTKEGFVQMGVSAAQMNMEKLITEITLPLLLIWGKADKLTNPKKALEILKNNNLVCASCIIPQAGHVVSLEKPAQVAEAIEKFLHEKIV
jgi:pimeloyl-ACP methyl ester carboxylesterase